MTRPRNRRSQRPLATWLATVTLVAGLAAGVFSSPSPSIAVAAVADGVRSLLAADVLAQSSAGLLTCCLLGLAASGDDAADLRTLVDGVRDLTAGNDDVAFDLDREDELGELADALDDLAADVRDRERRRQEREAYTEELLDAIDDLFYVLDKDGEHRQWNQTLRDVTGYTEAEFEAMHPLDLFEGTDRERAAAAMEEAFEEGHTRVELDITTKSGDLVPHEFVASRVEAPDGTPVVTGIARDITERRAAERQRAENERYRRRLYEITSDPELDTGDAIEQLLELGRERLGVANAHLTNVDVEAGEHEVAEAVGSSLVEAGAETDLEETYCEATIDADSMLAIRDTAAGRWADHPATKRWDVGCYVGVQLYAAEEFHGTVCFVDEEPRTEPFTAAEKTFVELIARSVSQLRQRREQERQRRESEQYRQKLYEITSDRTLDVDETISQLLDLGCERLGVECGVVSKIDRALGRYEVERVRGADLAEEGMVTDLSNTFCHLALDTDDVFGIHDAVAAEFEDHPEHQEWGIYSYLGTDIVVGDELYGTLCFFDREPRAAPFTEVEKAFVDLMARWTSQAFERRAHTAELRSKNRAMDAAPVGVTVADATEPDDPVVYANEEFEELTGYGPEWYLGRNCRFLQGEDTDPEAVDELREAIDAEEQVSVELRNYRKDGTEFWNRVSIAPVENEHGEVTEFVGFQEDVTERKEAERQLREREQRLQRQNQYVDDVIDSLDDLFYVLDADGEYRRYNESHLEVTGYDEAAFEELSALDVIAEEDRPTIAAAIDAAFEDGSARAEASILTKDGSRIPYEFEASTLEDPDDNRVLVGIGRDISERRERERQLEALVENTTDVIYIKDREGTYQFINRAGANYFGLAPQQVIGSDDEALFDEETVEDVTGDDERVIENGERVTREVTRPIEGEDHVFMDQKYPYKDEEGNIVGVMGISRDITDRVESERELERTTDLLSRAEAMADIGAFSFPVGEGFDGPPYPSEWSEHLYELFELPPDSEPPANVFQFYHHEDRDRHQAAVDRAIETGEPWDQELRLVTAAGNERWVHSIGQPVLEDGEVVEVRGVMQNVTEQKRHEHELERTKDLLEQAQRVSRIGGWEMDLQTDPPELSWTEQLYDIHGVDEDYELAFESVVELYHPEDREMIFEINQSAIENAESYDMEGRVLDEDAENGYRWIRALGEPVVEDDEVVALRGSVQDITEQKHHERELERTKDMLQQAQRMGGVGGWEIDVSEPPYDGIWTEGFFDVYEIDAREDFTLDDRFEYVHPDERDWVRAEITRGIQSGEPFSLEHRIVTGEGPVRWVRVVAEPIGEDRYRGAVLDLTEQKERELIMEALHETARGLLQTQTPSEVADLAMETAQDVLDVPCLAVYLLDDESGRLEPAAYSDAFETACGEPRASTSSEADPLLWEAYVSESATGLSGSSTSEAGIFQESVEEAIYVPIGDHGVFVAAASDRTLDHGTRRIAETLVATMEAALHRLDSETDLRERETELAAQNRRLRRQIQINEIIRTVDQSLIGASSREEIETAVCERLTDGEDVAFAWIGALDSTGDALVPRAWAGQSHDYLDAVSLTVGQQVADPAVQTATTGESTVVGSVVQSVKSEDWRKHALVSNFSSAVAVPIAIEDYRYGVLAVYGTEPDQFGDLERAVFEELGEGIANSINDVETRQALYADAFVELTIEFEDAEDFLARVARETGGTVEYVGLGTHSEDESRVFFEVADVDAEAVEAMLSTTVSVEDFRQIAAGDEQPLLYEATVAGELIAAKLVRHGGIPRSMRATAGDLEVTVDVPASMDVREFLESLREYHPSAELLSRRDVQRDVETRQELVTGLFEELTDRQLEVLRTAYFAGFFGWPRESTGEDIAELLDVSQPTVNRHVRHGLQRLLQQLFEEEPATIAQA